MSCSHELHVRILRELIGKVNCGKYERARYLFVIVRDRNGSEDMCISWQRVHSIRSVAESSFLFRRTSNRYCKNAWPPSDIRIFMHFTIARETSSKREPFNPPLPRVKIHTCSRVCRVQWKCMPLEALSRNRQIARMLKCSWIYNCRVYIVLYIFARRLALQSVSIAPCIRTIYTHARCSILGSKKEAHKYRYYYCIV